MTVYAEFQILKFLKPVLLVALLTMLLGCDSSSDDVAIAVCKVNDINIAKSYSGDCKEGLADGNGVADGRDNYQGEFKSGEAHGFGIYSWGSNSERPTQRNEGWQYKGKLTGFSVSSVAVDSKHPNLDFYKEKGVLEGDRYVVRGLWLDGEYAKSSSEKETFKYINEEFLKLKELAKSDANKNRLFTINRMRQGIEKFMLEQVEKSNDNAKFETMIECILDDSIQHHLAKYPDQTVLDGASALELFSFVENNKRLAPVLGNCFYKTKSGTFREDKAIDPYQLVDIDMLKVDIPYLDAEKIKVSGVGVYIAETLAIKRDREDPNFIMVNPANLPRIQKIKITKECSNIILGCPITVFGTVGVVGFNNGIIADKIE